MNDSYKERWQMFFEQAEDELRSVPYDVGDIPFDVIAEQADRLLADDEADRIDQAYEQSREKV